ncbi:Hypothetical protein NTJ_10484 [Nesidiocoris tenuis]|uniref:Uncharacterized protein n=1 Tax=Nesidiocoris tenuis TaxID=355587 RepID=A0ABN7AZS6_9HEMI|nr:Hypothetical protein NTJ_10484 [Nesidiocoris tenuis]
MADRQTAALMKMMKCVQWEKPEENAIFAFEELARDVLAQSDELLARCEYFKTLPYSELFRRSGLLSV